MLRKATSLVMSLVLAMGLVPIPAFAEASAAAAVVPPFITTQEVVQNGTCGGCVWSIDDAGALTIDSMTEEEAQAAGVEHGVLPSNDALSREFWPWYERRATIMSITVGADVVLGASAAYVFADCESVETIDVSKLDASNTTDMRWMFNNCSSLTSLDLTGFNTSSATDMWFMFSGCSSLERLDVSGFNTSNVADMNSMFALCSKLTSLNVSGFDTSQVRSMGSMFSGCSSLTSLDVSRFNTSNVQLMTRMFAECSSLTAIDVSHFNTSSLRGTTGMSGMFRDCASLTSLDLSSFDTTEQSDIERFTSFMFTGDSLNQLVLGERTALGSECGLVGNWQRAGSESSVSAAELIVATQAGTAAGTWTLFEASEPEEPTVPDTPEAPTEPEPETPATPVTPTTPETPAAPQQPETPQQPAAPEQPATPAAIDISGALVEVEGDNFIFNRLFHEPPATVRLGGGTLEPGEDYKLEYADNYDAGRATVIVLGCGRYVGEVRAYFNIMPYDIARTNLTISKRHYTWSKKHEQKPGTMITHPGDLSTQSLLPAARSLLRANAEAELTRGVDYEVSYSNNIEPGTATVTAVGKGNYTGSVSTTFTIDKAANTMKAKVQVKKKGEGKKKIKFKRKVIKNAKRAKRTVNRKSIFKIKGAKGKLSFRKLSGTRRISVSKSGQLTVANTLKVGSYKVRVRVHDAGNKHYEPTNATVALAVRIT